MQSRLRISQAAARSWLARIRASSSRTDAPVQSFGNPALEAVLRHGESQSAMAAAALRNIGTVPRRRRD